MTRSMRLLALLVGLAAGELQSKKVLNYAAEINKDFKLPGICKEYGAGTCTREIVNKNPKGCSRGAHMSSEAYAKLKEKNKIAIKEAKDKRNRSQSAPPGPG